MKNIVKILAVAALVLSAVSCVVVVDDYSRDLEGTRWMSENDIVNSYYLEFGNGRMSMQYTEYDRFGNPYASSWYYGSYTYRPPQVRVQLDPGQGWISSFYADRNRGSNRMVLYLEDEYGPYDVVLRRI